MSEKGASELLGHDLTPANDHEIGAHDEGDLAWCCSFALDPRIATRGPKAGRPRRCQTARALRADYLSTDRAAALIEAFLFAEEKGGPLTAHVTVTMDGSGRKAADVERAVNVRRAVTDCLRDFFGKADHPAAFLYAMETRELGLHTHFLVHIDPARWLLLKPQLEERLRVYLVQLGLRERWTSPTGRSIDMLKITPPQEPGGEDAPAGLEDRLRLLGYLVKATDPLAIVETDAGPVNFADLLHFYLQSDIGRQGRIVGRRRMGNSQNLGPKSRGQLGQIPGVLDWIRRVNEMREVSLRLPGPEAIANLLGTSSPTATSEELEDRRAKLVEFRKTWRRDARQARIQEALARFSAAA